jgi:hypothetical protein
MSTNQKQVVLSEYEIKWLAASPEALRVAADYHDYQATIADASDYADARWNWPTARSMELDAASHELRKSIMRALNKNSIGVGIATLECYS